MSSTYFQREMETDAFNNKHKKIEIIQLQDVDRKRDKSSDVWMKTTCRLQILKQESIGGPQKNQTMNRGIALESRTEKSARSTYPLSKSRKRWKTIPGREHWTLEVRTSRFEEQGGIFCPWERFHATKVQFMPFSRPSQSDNVVRLQE